MLTLNTAILAILTCYVIYIARDYYMLFSDERAQCEKFGQRIQYGANWKCSRNRQLHEIPHEELYTSVLQWYCEHSSMGDHGVCCQQDMKEYIYQLPLDDQTALWLEIMLAHSDCYTTPVRNRLCLQEIPTMHVQLVDCV